MNVNLTDAEGSTVYLDFLSTGFKMRTADALVNGNTNNYFMLAWGSEPVVNSNGTPATAN